MLKSFRRFFAQRTPVEFDVYRRENPPESTEEDDAGIEPPQETPSEQAMEILEAVASVRTDLERQLGTHEHIATALNQIEPIGRQVTQRLDALAGNERHLAELVHTFSTHSSERDEALQLRMTAMHETTERQVQVLTVLQEQIDRSQSSMQELAQRFTDVGTSIDALLKTQQTTANHTEELVDAVRDQVKAISMQQRRTFMITITILVLAAIALIVAIILAAV